MGGPRYPNGGCRWVSCLPMLGCCCCWGRSLGDRIDTRLSTHDSQHCENRCIHTAPKDAHNKLCQYSYVLKPHDEIATRAVHIKEKHKIMRVFQLNEDTLPRVSVRCLTAGGALILRCSGFGLAMMSFFNFNFRVGSETAHTNIHK